MLFRKPTVSGRLLSVYRELISAVKIDSEYGKMNYWKDKSIKADIIKVPYSKCLRIYVQGNIDDRTGKSIFLTVHDVGENGKSFMDFVDSPDMVQVKKKSIWFHVILPGQDANDGPLPPTYVFPSMDDIAKDLAVVLDAYKIKGTVIGFGEGAGANILLRFGLNYPNRCLGLILMECSPTNAGIDEHLWCKMYNWKENGAKLWNKMINTMSKSKLEMNKPRRNKSLRSGNVGRYLEAFMRRDDISLAVEKTMGVDAVLICGAQSCFVQDAYYLNRLNCSRSTILILDDTVSVLAEAPKNLARALILFCKGVGILTSVPLLGLEKEFQRVQDKQENARCSLQEKQNHSKMAETIRMYEDWVDFEA